MEITKALLLGLVFSVVTAPSLTAQLAVESSSEEQTSDEGCVFPINCPPNLPIQQQPAPQPPVPQPQVEQPRVPSVPTVIPSTPTTPAVEVPQQVGLQSGATANNSTSNTLDNLGNQTSSLDDGVSEGQGDGPGFLRAALSPTSKRWQIFTTFDYGSLHLANGVTGIRSDTYAEGLGTLYRVSPHFALGGSVGNLHSRGIFANGGGAIHADGIAMAAFGVASWGNTFVDLAYGATLIDSKVNRNSPTVQAAGRADSTVHSIAFKLGHNLRYGRWVTGPRVGLDYSHWSQKGYTESGTGAPLLSVPHLNTESLVTRVEWHASYDITTRFGKVVPRAHLGWHRETMGGRPGGNYTIVGGGTALVTTGVSRIRHYMVAGAGVSMDLGANWKASADYVGQFLNDAFQIHNVSVMLSYGF